MNKETQETMFSSDKQNWETPQDKWNEWNNIYDFQIDLASSKENSKCGEFYIDEEIDSLSVDWHTLTDGWMWINPPYDQSKEFIKKCDEEAKKGAKIVCLLPSRTDTIAFHTYIYKKYEIDFLKGRLKFEINGEPIPYINKKTGKATGKGQSAPFPSMLVFFKK